MVLHGSSGKVMIWSLLLTWLVVDWFYVVTGLETVGPIWQRPMFHVRPTVGRFINSKQQLAAQEEQKQE